MIGFVLSGGANLGSIHVGMLKALLEAGIKPDVIVGTSIGAVNAAHLAAAPTLENVERLQELWCDVRAGAIFPLSPLHNARALFRDGAFFGPSLAALKAQGRSTATSKKPAVQLRITATDYEEGRSVVFDSGPVLDAVLASTALPGIFPPYEVDGRCYIDGAISDQLPLKAALEAGADTIYVMAVSVPSPPPDRRSPLTILRHSLTILLYPRIRLDALDLPGSQTKLKIVQVPSLATQVSLWDMSRHGKLIASAYDTTKEFLKHEHDRDGRLEVATVPEMEVETQTPEEPCVEP